MDGPPPEAMIEWANRNTVERNSAGNNETCRCMDIGKLTEHDLRSIGLAVQQDEHGQRVFQLCPTDCPFDVIRAIGYH
jgi:hypothetical protein